MITNKNKSLVIGLSIALGAVAALTFFQFQQSNSINQMMGQLQIGGQDKTDQIKSLGEQVSELNTRYADLEEQNKVLESKASHWQDQYENLNDQYQSLQSEYESLVDENSSLKGEAQYYKGQASTAKSQQNELEQELSLSLNPPYTIIQEREIKWIFKDSQDNVYEWNMPIDTYRAWIEAPEPTDTLTLRADDGSVYSVYDYTKFVNSDSFAKVIDDVYVNAGSDYQFVYEVWYIVSQLTTYSSDIGDDPRWPLETFTEAGGDCEDLTIVIATMLKSSSHTKDWKIQMILFDADNPNSPRDIDHVALNVQTTEFSTFVESTTKSDGLDSWDYIKGWYFDL